MTLSAGDKLWPCEVFARIGVGDMDEVWKALETGLNRLAAVKRPNDQHDARLEQEAHAIAQRSSGGAVPVAMEHSEEFAPRTHGLPVLVTHDP